MAGQQKQPIQKAVTPAVKPVAKPVVKQPVTPMAKPVVKAPVVTQKEKPATIQTAAVDKKPVTSTVDPKNANAASAAKKPVQAVTPTADQATKSIAQAKIVAAQRRVQNASSSAVDPKNANAASALKNAPKPTASKIALPNIRRAITKLTSDNTVNRVTQKATDIAAQRQSKVSPDTGNVTRTVDALNKGLNPSKKLADNPAIPAVQSSVARTAATVSKTPVAKNLPRGKIVKKPASQYSAVRATVKNNEPVNANTYKGTPQAERDRADSLREAHVKDNPSVFGKSHLGGEGLKVREKVRDKVSNQRMSKRYTAEQEKRLGDTLTKKPGETIDLEPMKREMPGQIK